MKYIILFIAVVAMLFWFLQPAPYVPASPIREAAIASYIYEDARTELRESTLVTMPIAGRLLPVNLRAGDLVTKGQELARLDEEELRDQIAQARAQLAGFEAAYASHLFSGYEDLVDEQSDRLIQIFSEIVQSSEARVVASQANNEVAAFLWTQAQDLYEKGVIPEAEWRERQASAVSAEMGLRADELTLASVRGMDVMVSLVPSFVDAYRASKKVSDAEHESRIAEAKVRIAMLEQDLRRCVIVAEHDGVIIRTLHRDEQVLQAGTSIIEMGNFADLEVTCDVLSEDVYALREGSVAEIRFGYGTDLSCSGTVRRIDPAAFTQLSSLGVRQQRVPVHIRLDVEELKTLQKKGLQLGVDYRVQARLEIQKLDRALLVPRTAIVRQMVKQGNTQEFIWIITDSGVLELRPVTVVLQSDIECAVEGSVDIGEQVVIAPASDLYEGMAARAREN